LSASSKTSPLLHLSPFEILPGWSGNNQQPIPQIIINLTADISQARVVIKEVDKLSATVLGEITPLGLALVEVLIHITLDF
jgi:hypothetical protein